MDPIQANIRWTIRQVAILTEDVKQKPPRERGGYYKAAFFFAASAIEALAYLIVKDFYDGGEAGTYPVETVYTHLHTLPKRLFGKVAGSIGIYEKRTKSFVWREGMDFRTLNQIIQDNGLCSKTLCAGLERVRKQRNRVHMQSLGEKDHQYTQKDVNAAQSMILRLLGLLSKH